MLINGLWISSGGSPCKKLTWASVSRLNKSFQLFVYLLCVLGFSFDVCRETSVRFNPTHPPIHPPTHPPICELSTGLVILASRPFWVVWQWPRVSECCCCCRLEIFPKGECTAIPASSWFFPMTRALCTQCIRQWRKAERHATPIPEVQSPLMLNSQNHIPRRWCAPPAFKT